MVGGALSRDDDLQSVTSQSSAADSDAASDRTDLSNGHHHHQYYPNPLYGQEPPPPSNAPPHDKVKAPKSPPAPVENSGSEFDALFAKSSSSSGRRQQENSNNGTGTGTSLAAVVHLSQDLKTARDEGSSNKRTVTGRMAAKRATLGIAMIASSLSPPTRAKSRSPSPPLPVTRTRAPRSPLLPPVAASAAPVTEARSSVPLPPRKVANQRKAHIAVAPATDNSSETTSLPESAPAVPPPKGDRGKLVKGRRGGKTQTPPLPRPPSPLDDLDLDFPKRVIPEERRAGEEGGAATKRAIVPNAYKKGKIFKSRAVRPPPSPELESASVKTELGTDADRRRSPPSPEPPPRVPPVSRHFVELGSKGSSSSGDDGAARRGVKDTLVVLSPDKPDAKVRWYLPRYRKSE